MTEKKSLTVSDLKAILDLPRYSPTASVEIILDKGSVGGNTASHVVWAGFGFGRDHGRFLLKAQDSLVIKTEDEKLFDMARDLIIWLGTKPVKRDSYEIRSAKRILERMGFSEEKIKEYRKMIHGL